MTNQELREFNSKRRIHQVAMVTNNLEETMEKWVKYLNIGPWKVIAFTNDVLKDFIVYDETVNEPFKFLLAFTKVGDLEFELIQPVYGPNIYNKFLKEKGAGLHHVKEKISNETMPETVEAYRKSGIEVTQSGLYGASTHYYLNTEPFLDFIYELGNCPENNVTSAEITFYPPEDKEIAQ